jgi:hypothetical protein
MCALGSKYGSRLKSINYDFSGSAKRTLNGSSHSKLSRVKISMKRIVMKGLSILALTLFVSTTAAWAQSLKSEAPAPLQAGINKGTVDNMIGTHYWYLDGLPGHVHLHCQFKPMGLLGNAYKSTVTFTLYDAANTWRTPKILTSDSKVVDCTFDGDLKAPTKLIMSVAPPPDGLVRAGGDYEIEASGAVAFGKTSNEPPIVGMYKQMCGYTTVLGDCKFSADGGIQTTSGEGGNWKLFDKDSRTYVINIDGQDRHSLQLVPGRGLCDGDAVVFQQIR